MQPAGQLDGEVARIPRDQVEQPARGDEREQPLEGFEQRDRSQAALQAAEQR